MHLVFNNNNNLLLQTYIYNNYYMTTTPDNPLLHRTFYRTLSLVGQITCQVSQVYMLKCDICETSDTLTPSLAAVHGIAFKYVLWLWNF
jgi:hypothetical protein